MKKLIGLLFLISFILGCSNNSSSEEEIEMSCGIFEGNINLRTPGEIAQFAECNYTEITGNLGIFDGNIQNPITDLSALSSLRKIGGRLSLTSLSVLNSLNGLHNIESARSLGVAYVEKLENLDDLDRLQTISIEIVGNAALRNIDALDMISNEMSGIAFYDNPVLENLNCFSNITSIRKVLILDNNDSLVDLTGLNNVENIGLDYLFSVCCGSFYISNNQNLVSLEGLNNVTQIRGHMWITNNFSLQNIDAFANLNNINGDLTIRQNPFLENINGFVNLLSLDGDIAIHENSSLRKFCGLRNLFLADGHDGEYLVFGNFFNPTPTNITNAPPCD